MIGDKDMMIKWFDADNYIFFYYGYVWVIKDGELYSQDGDTRWFGTGYDVNDEFVQLNNKE